MYLSYYVAGNTAAGRVNVLASNVEAFAHIIYLKHPSPQVKTDVLRQWMNHMKSKVENIELIESVEGKPFIDGIILRKEKCAILSDTIYDESIKNTHTIDLTSYILETESRLQNVAEYQSNVQKMVKKAEESFSTGLRIHDELEHIYIQRMDFEKADAVAIEWIQRYIPTTEKQQEKGRVQKRLFGTNTAEGAINSIPEIIRAFPIVHHVKGRAGTGKSYFMNAIANTFVQRGFSIEKYICSFDPSSTDMVIVRDLNICLFDSTNPHALKPKKADIVIDLYEKTVDQTTDERYRDSIDQTTKKYKRYMQEGMHYLKKARIFQEEIDALYENSLSMKKMEEIQHAIEQVAIRKT